MIDYKEIIDITSKCFLPFNFMSIGIHGEFYACCYIYIDNIKNYNSVSDAWNCEKIEDIRNRVNLEDYDQWPEECKVCQLRYKNKVSMYKKI